MPVIVARQGAPRVIVVQRKSTAAVQTPAVETVVAQHRLAVNTVAASTHAVEVSSPGAQGPVGPIGPPGPAGGDVFVRQAATALGGHRVVRSTGAGAVGYASAMVDAHGDDVLGITLGAAAAGGDVEIQAAGEIVEPSWSWTPQEPIFLADDGLLTQVVPGFGAAFSLVLGFATSATSMQVRIETPIFFED